jgi:hypothetical protein
VVFAPVLAAQALLTQYLGEGLAAVGEHAMAIHTMVVIARLMDIPIMAQVMRHTTADILTVIPGRGNQEQK